MNPFTQKNDVLRLRKIVNPVYVQPRIEGDVTASVMPITRSNTVSAKVIMKTAIPHFHDRANDMKTSSE
jgi:hypothetical protein